MAAMTVHLDPPLPPVAALLGNASARQGNPLQREAQALAAPAHTALIPVAGTLVHISAQGRQSLGQAAAALKNQNTLLQALGTTAQTGAAPATQTAIPVASTGQAPPVASPVAPAATEAAAPTVAPSVSSNSSPLPLSNALVRSYESGKAQLPALLGSLASASTGQSTSSVAGDEAVAAPAMHWPSQGVGKPLFNLIQTLVQQATSSLGTQRVLAAQHWPAALVPVVDPQSPATSDTDLVPLQTWLVHQGVVQTREGPRGVSITLRVPAPWLRALEQTQTTTTGPLRPGNGWIANPPPAPAAPAAVPRPLQAVFAGPSAGLQSGVVALALESPAMAGVRTSALMLLEFQPLLRSSASTQASVLYGRQALHLHQDPWLQMATLQASGQVRHEEEDLVHASAALCDTPGCPYQGETACIQPFCMVLRALAPVDALAGSSSAHGPHTPGLR